MKRIIWISAMAIVGFWGVLPQPAVATGCVPECTLNIHCQEEGVTLCDNCTSQIPIFPGECEY